MTSIFITGFRHRDEAPEKPRGVIYWWRTGGFRQVIRLILSHLLFYERSAGVGSNPWPHDRSRGELRGCLAVRGDDLAQQRALNKVQLKLFPTRGGLCYGVRC